MKFPGHIALSHIRCSHNIPNKINVAEGNRIIATQGVACIYAIQIDIMSHVKRGVCSAKMRLQLIARNGYAAHERSFALHNFKEKIRIKKCRHEYVLWK
jgi:hypothetical protein